MGERARLCFLIVSQALHFGASVFFHEPSAIILHPDKAVNPNSDFGFSMAHQKGDSPKLVISAPSNDRDGKVYSCPLSDHFYSNISCKDVEINISQLANETARLMSPNQKFYLGSSIAATSDYFLTCAPLWTRYNVKMMNAFYDPINYPYGTCYVYYHTTDTVYRHHGIMEQKLGSDEIREYTGGMGWNTLVDETNGLLLIAKSSQKGNILFLKLQDVLKESKTKKNVRHEDSLTKEFRNAGFGLAAGNFFSNMTLYAFNVDDDDMIGNVLFLEYNLKYETLTIIFNNEEPYRIRHETVGIMFGSALCGVDINLDGYSELLVGAPTQANADGEGVEFGAVHIYLGGDIKAINDVNRMRSIFGIKDGARFGSTIAANDIDGDNIPEIFISAPYEDFGEGTVYVLSGYELNNVLISYGGFKQIQLSQLQLTQTLRREGYRSFGFSLQVIPDIDSNGCDELAVGSPGNSTALMFGCMQFITVNISSRLLGSEIVSLQDDDFTVEVCINVEYHLNSKPLTGLLLVNNNVMDYRLHVIKPDFYVDLSHNKTLYCNNITVAIISENKTSAEYTFFTQLTLLSDMTKEKHNDTWVSLCPYSEKRKTLEISRHCTGDDCKPKLSLKIDWSGGNGTYTLGSTDVETVRIIVRNDGNNSYDACVWVQLSGAQLTQFDAKCENDRGGYLCQLPKPLPRDMEYLINIYLNMRKPRNIDLNLAVDVRLYENCRKNNFTVEESIKGIYKLSGEKVFLNGSSQDFDVTDKELRNKDELSLKSAHEYYIKNDGPIAWMDLSAVLDIENHFIDKLTVSSTEKDKICVEQNIGGKVTFTCKFDLMPNSTVKFIVFMDISKKKIEDTLKLDNDKKRITSQLLISLKPTNVTVFKRLTTVIDYNQVLTVGDNKNMIILIATIVGIIILILIGIILYKLGFFKRKEKKKLNELRESIRKRSIKHPSEKTVTTNRETEEDNLDIEMVEYNNSEEFSLGTSRTPIIDDIKLREDTAEIHC